MRLRWNNTSPALGTTPGTWYMFSGCWRVLPTALSIPTSKSSVPHFLYSSSHLPFAAVIIVALPPFLSVAFPAFPSDVSEAQSTLDSIQPTEVWETGGRNRRQSLQLQWGSLRQWKNEETQEANTTPPTRFHMSAGSWHVNPHSGTTVPQGLCFPFFH